MNGAWNVKSIGYWTATGILALVLVSGGVAYLLRVEAAVAGIVALGYPVYFLSILGFWKVLAGIAILAPRFPRLKEWAYAGIVFDLTGAFASHVVSGSSADHFFSTALLTLLALASWALRPSSRTLGNLFPPRTSRKGALAGTPHPQPAP